MSSLLALLLGLILPLASQAATYTAGSCASATHSSFQAAYSALGNQSGPHTLRLCPETHLVSPQGASWGHANLAIESVSGNPLDTLLLATGSHIIQTSYQSYTVRNVEVQGNLRSDTGGITLDNVLMDGNTTASGSGPITVIDSSIDEGDLTTQGVINVSDSTVVGVVSGRNGVTIDNVTASGEITSTNGTVTLTDSDVQAEIFAQNGINSTNTNITGDVQIAATNGQINLTGGTIAGDITTLGNDQQINLDGIEMPSGSITGATAPIYVSNSCIGGTLDPGTGACLESGNVPISNNHQMEFDNTVVWGSATAAPWTDVDLNDNSNVYGPCYPEEVNGVCGEPPEPNGYSHIRILHPGTSLTCNAFATTIRACANAACSILYSDPVEVELGPAGVNWTGGSTLTFTEQVSVTAQYTTPGTVTLSAGATSPAADDPTRCFVGGTETCQMTFAEAGFVIDLPDHVAGETQIGQISAVRADDPGEACVPGFSNETREVAFWASYQDPDNGPLSPTITGDDNTPTPITNADPGTSIAIAFDSNGEGGFDWDYLDVGQLQLSARFAGSGNEAGLLMLGTQTVTVRPHHFELTLPDDDSEASDINGSAFVAAGAPFTIQVSARNALDQVTPNFGQESTPEGVDLELTVQAPSPAPASPPLSGAFQAFGLACDGSPGAAGTACGESFSWPEVGIINLTPRLADPPYLGVGTEDVVGEARGNIGRFHPARFALSQTELVNRADASCSSASNFTYLGEVFEGRFLLEALATDSSLTRNYHANFALLADSSDLNWAAVDTGGSFIALTNDLDLEGSTALDWDEGMLWVEQSLRVERSAAPAGPYEALQLGVAPADADSVTVPNPALVTEDGEAASHHPVDTTRLRFGRLIIDNAVGSELAPVDLPWRAEYWQDSTWWTNDQDDCTKLLPPDQIGLSSSSGQITNGDQPITIGSGSTQINTDNSLLTLTDGKGHIRLDAPVPAVQGWIDLELLLNVAWPFLRDDLDNDGVFDNQPAARATFGLFEGNPRQVILQELQPR